MDELKVLVEYCHGDELESMLYIVFFFFFFL